MALRLQMANAPLSLGIDDGGAELLSGMFLRQKSLIVHNALNIQTVFCLFARREFDHYLNEWNVWQFVPWFFSGLVDLGTNAPMKDQNIAFHLRRRNKITNHNVAGTK